MGLSTVCNILSLSTKRIFLAFMGLGVIISCFAEPIPELTLREAVYLALRYNINIQSAELDRTVQKFDLALAYHGFEPQFSLTGATEYTVSKANGVKTVTESYNLTPKAKLKTALGSEISLAMNNAYDDSSYNQGATLEVTQPLLRGFGPTIARYALLNAIDQEKINQLNLKRLVTDQVRLIIIKYRQLLLDYNNVRINQLSLQNTIDRTKKTEVEVKAGRLPGLEVLQSQSSIPRQQLAVSQAENQLAQDKNDLLNSIGLRPDFQFTIPNIIEVKITKLPELKEAIRTALQNNMEYQTALLNIKTAERALQKAQDDARWRLDLKAGVGTGSTVNAATGGNIFDSANNSKNVGINLEIPLDRMRLDREIAASKISLQKAHMALAQLRRSIELDVASKLNNIKAQEQQIQLAIASRDINVKVLNAEQKKLTYGRSSTFQVNILQRDLIDSEQQIVQSQINYLNALVELQSLLGTLLNEWEISIRY